MSAWPPQLNNLDSYTRNGLLTIILDYTELDLETVCDISDTNFLVSYYKDSISEVLADAILKYKKDTMEYIITNHKLYYSNTNPLMAASKIGDLHTLSRLLRKDGNNPNDMALPFGVACRYGHLKIVEYLFQICSDYVNRENLYVAFENSHLDIVDFILKHSEYLENVCCIKRQLLLSAISMSNLQNLEYILKLGIDADVFEDKEHLYTIDTRIHSIKNYDEIVNILKEHSITLAIQKIIYIKNAEVYTICINSSNYKPLRKDTLNQIRNTNLYF